MSTTPRALRTPRPVAACWSLSVLAGLLLVLLGPHPPRPEPDGLHPHSLAGHLRRVAGPGAQHIRVNGLYGSGHHGAWQFVAHLTWRTPEGQLAGGITRLPQHAGSPALESDLDQQRLMLEEKIGWTLATLDAVLDRQSGTHEALALLELEIPQRGQALVTVCHSSDTRARCESRDHTAQRRAAFRDRLVDEPLLEALAVQRDGHRLRLGSTG